LILAACRAVVEGDSTGTPERAPAEVAPLEVEAQVLQQAARTLGWEAPDHVCSRLDLSTEGAAYRLDCVVAAGHSVDVRIQRLESPDAAEDAFEAARKGHSVQDFHGYPAAVWQRDERPGNPGMPMRHRYHVWRAERWLVTVHSFDDTHFALAPEPTGVSAAVYQAALKVGLFQVGSAPDPSWELACRTAAPKVGCRGAVIAPASYFCDWL